VQRPERTERSDRPEGERTGRRSRRGGRRRRREPGEAQSGAEPPVMGESQANGPQDSAPESRSFDFDREPARPAAPAVPVTAVEPRPEWTPTPPSDATREGPRSEP